MLWILNFFPSRIGYVIFKRRSIIVLLPNAIVIKMWMRDSVCWMIQSALRFVVSVQSPVPMNCNRVIGIDCQFSIPIPIDSAFRKNNFFHLISSPRLRPPSFRTNGKLGELRAQQRTIARVCTTLNFGFLYAAQSLRPLFGIPARIHLHHSIHRAPIFAPFLYCKENSSALAKMHKVKQIQTIQFYYHCHSSKIIRKWN